MFLPRSYLEKKDNLLFTCSSLKPNVKIPICFQSQKGTVTLGKCWKESLLSFPNNLLTGRTKAPGGVIPTWIFSLPRLQQLTAPSLACHPASRASNTQAPLPTLPPGTVQSDGEWGLTVPLIKNPIQGCMLPCEPV